MVLTDSSSALPSCALRSQPENLCILNKDLGLAVSMSLCSFQAGLCHDDPLFFVHEGACDPAKVEWAKFRVSLAAKSSVRQPCGLDTCYEWETCSGERAQVSRRRSATAGSPGPRPGRLSLDLLELVARSLATRGPCSGSFRMQRSEAAGSRYFFAVSGFVRYLAFHFDFLQSWTNICSICFLKSKVKRFNQGSLYFRKEASTLLPKYTV